MRKFKLILTFALLCLVLINFQNCSEYGGTVGNPLTDEDVVSLKIDAYDPMNVVGFGPLTEFKFCATYIILSWTQLNEDIDFTGQPPIFEWQPNVFIEQSRQEVWVDILREVELRPEGVDLGSYKLPQADYDSYSMYSEPILNNNGNADCPDPANETIRVTNAFGTFTSGSQTRIQFNQNFSYENDEFLNFSIQEYIDLLVQQSTQEDFDKNATGVVAF